VVGRVGGWAELVCVCRRERECVCVCGGGRLGDRRIIGGVFFLLESIEPLHHIPVFDRSSSWPRCTATYGPLHHPTSPFSLLCVAPCCCAVRRPSSTLLFCVVWCVGCRQRRPLTVREDGAVDDGDGLGGVHSVGHERQKDGAGVVEAALLELLGFVLLLLLLLFVVWMGGWVGVGGYFCL
jgi:hypothetical protein